MNDQTVHAGPYVTIGSHVPALLAEQLSELARANERSISGEVRLAIKRHLAARRETASALIAQA